MFPWISCYWPSLPLTCLISTPGFDHWLALPTLLLSDHPCMTPACIMDFAITNLLLTCPPVYDPGLFLFPHLLLTDPPYEPWPGFHYRVQCSTAAKYFWSS